jgi:hypothetical protein
VAAIFWTWLWGVAGLLLATPLTVCLLVIGKHVPQLSFLDTLLGNEPVFEPKKRVYQRLLAGDQEEAAELLDDLLKVQPLVEIYDTVLIPALASAESHWHRGELAEGRHTFILQSLREIIEDLSQREPDAKKPSEAENTQKADGCSAPVVAGSSPPARILCLPARDEADEIASMMLAQSLEAGRWVVEGVAVSALASEMVALVEERQPTVVCISATPPTAVMHARYLTRRIRARMPRVQMVVGLWDTSVDLAKAQDRIGCGPGVHVVATMADALEQIRLLVQPPIPPPTPSEGAGHRTSDHSFMA